jgi:hypothetical protein
MFASPKGAKMKRITLVLGLVILTAAASFAQTFDFTLVNDTGYTIDSVYVSPAASSDWEENVLDAKSLDDGDKVEIVFDPEYEAILLSYGVDTYDLKVVYDDDSSDEWTNLKLEDISELTLSLDDTGNGIASVK